MADEWLRADQVQAMAERAVDGFTPSRSTVLALVAQDGRWRALVGALMIYARHTAACVPTRERPCNCGWTARRDAALASLDGAAAAAPAVDWAGDVRVYRQHIARWIQVGRHGARIEHMEALAEMGEALLARCPAPPPTRGAAE
jgi:hypothetical protein